jgi:hypothetical protein
MLAAQQQIRDLEERASEAVFNSFQDQQRIQELENELGSVCSNAKKELETTHLAALHKLSHQKAVADLLAVKLEHMYERKSHGLRRGEMSPPIYSSNGFTYLDYWGRIISTFFTEAEQLEK